MKGIRGRGKEFNNITKNKTTTKLLLCQLVFADDDDSLGLALLVK